MFKTLKKECGRWWALAILTTIIFIVFVASDNSDNYISHETSSPSNYSVGGITFEIPGKYIYNDGTFSSNYSILHIESQEKVDGFWEVYLLASNKDIDDIADNAVNQILSDGYRESALDSNVAGQKSRIYTYSGIKNDEKYLLSLEIIMDTNIEGFIMAAFLTPEDNSELDDYYSISENAEFTGAADSINNPNSEFYMQ